MYTTDVHYVARGTVIPKDILSDTTLDLNNLLMHMFQLSIKESLIDPWSLSLTNQTCSSRVSRKRGKGRNGWGGWEVGTFMKLPFGCMREAYSGMHLEID